MGVCSTEKSDMLVALCCSGEQGIISSTVLGVLAYGQRLEVVMESLPAMQWNGAEGRDF